MKPAFKTAQELLAHAVFSEKGIDIDSPIFKHYFKHDHKDKVKKAMLKLMGNPGSLDDALKAEGAQELGQITFQGVDTENSEMMLAVPRREPACIRKVTIRTNRPLSYVKILGMFIE